MQSRPLEPIAGLDAGRLRIELAFLALLALLWGSSYLLIKVAVETIPPFSLIALRVTIAAAFPLAVMTWRGECLPGGGAPPIGLGLGGSLLWAFGGRRERLTVDRHRLRVHSYPKDQTSDHT